MKDYHINNYYFNNNHRVFRPNEPLKYYILGRIESEKYNKSLIILFNDLLPNGISVLCNNIISYIDMTDYDIEDDDDDEYNYYYERYDKYDD